MMVRERACRKCRALTTEKACPVCGSTDLSENWSGLIIIIDPDNSEVAKVVGATVRGRYALNVV